MSLPDFPFESDFRTVEGMRLAHLDEGEGKPVVMWHGEPTWSFLWRKLLPPVRDAGYRVICPDLPGFGRSDKPDDVGWFSYDRLCFHAGRLLEDLDLRECTFVVHDWGGPIGLRAAVEHADRIDRLVVMDTGVWTGRQQMSKLWHAFAAFVRETEDLPVGNLVRGGCHRDPGDAVIAAYEEPFAGGASKAGPRALPLLIPLAEDAPGAAAGRATLDALSEAPWPTLMLWAEHDAVLPPRVGEAFARTIARKAPRPVPDAGHFLQEDQGELIGGWIADWLAAGG